MKALFFQVLMGPDVYFETDERDEALTLFNDLLIWGFRNRAIPETDLERRELYIGPPIGVREIHSKVIVRAWGGAARVSHPQPQAKKIPEDLEALLLELND